MICYAACPFGVLKITNNHEVILKENPELYYNLKQRLNQYFFVRLIDKN